MALRNIVQEGDSVLRRHCRPVTDFNQRLHTLLDDMRETLLDSQGVGLAGPQVGVARRVALVLDTSREELPPEQQIVELVNPEIIASSGEQDGPEGCLSVPGVYGMVQRPMKVTVRAQDRSGQTFEMTGEGLTARAFCHEIAHLDGQLFTDIASHILTEEEKQAWFEEDGE